MKHGRAGGDPPSIYFFLIPSLSATDALDVPSHKYTVCPGSSDPFYIVTVTTQNGPLLLGHTVSRVLHEKVQPPKTRHKKYIKIVFLRDLLNMNPVLSFGL